MSGQLSSTVNQEGSTVSRIIAQVHTAALSFLVFSDLFRIQVAEYTYIVLRHIKIKGNSNGIEKSRKQVPLSSCHDLTTQLLPNHSKYN